MEISQAQMENAIRQSDRWQVADGSASGGGFQKVLDNMFYTSVRSKLGVAADAPQLVDDSGPSNSTMRSMLGQKELSKRAIQNLSQSRQEYLRELSDRTVDSSSRPNLGLVSFASSTGQFVTSGNKAGLLNSSSNTTHLAPETYSPLFLAQNLQLPRDRLTANAWNRAFYETNPIVRNAINLHATYPISKLNIKCDDKKVEQFFQDMADRVGLQKVVQDTSLEFWKMGEVFIYASLDETTGMWDNIYQHNPDYIVVKSSSIQSKNPLIFLKPDPELQKIVNSSDPEHIRIRESLDPQLVHHIYANEYIPLDNFNISHLKNVASPYDVRGTSIIVSVWKDLMLYDKLRESKFVQADGMVNPMTLVKIGADGPEGFYPRQDEIENWRQIFEQAQYNKDFKIFTHSAVNVERVGYTGAVLDTNADFQMIIDNLFMGLMVPKSIMTQEGASYASASVALDVMRQRYNSFRTMMAEWLEKKIFAPISEIQKFYKLEGGKKRLIVPKVEWNHMTLYDLDNYIAHISTLVERKKVSTRTLDRSLGLSRENENVNIRQEAIEEAIMIKEREALGKMNLAQLRSLDPNEPIIDPEASRPSGSVSAPLPGMPGGGMDMGMGAGLGGMPPLPPMGDMGMGMPGGLPGMPMEGGLPGAGPGGLPGGPSPMAPGV